MPKIKNLSMEARDRESGGERKKLEVYIQNWHLFIY